jgi:hypothetical protein
LDRSRGTQLLASAPLRRHFHSMLDVGLALEARLAARLSGREAVERDQVLRDVYRLLAAPMPRF